MLSRRTAIALCLLAACTAAPVRAQIQPAPGGFSQGGFTQPTTQSPWEKAPAASPWERPPGSAVPSGPSPFDRPAQAGGEPPCMKDFMPLRLDAEKKAKAVQAASKRKAAPQEVCRLFVALVASQDKLAKFAEANVASCGIPREVPAQIKTALTQTDGVRQRVCDIASRPAGPAGPSLSDALGTSQVANPANVKRGGTFDTLSGSALGR